MTDRELQLPPNTFGCEHAWASNPDYIYSCHRCGATLTRREIVTGRQDECDGASPAGDESTSTGDAAAATAHAPTEPPMTTDALMRATLTCEERIEVAVNVERARIAAIIEANVPHDGQGSMNDCVGCQIVESLLRLIDPQGEGATDA